MASRAIAWIKEGGAGAEFADLLIEPGRLTAGGIAIGSGPPPYRMEYRLETHADFVTSALLVTTRGDGWWRELDLRRLRSGRWTARTRMRGDPKMAAPGGDISPLPEALDCDLGLSPLTNSLPVLRRGLLRRGGPIDFLMAWVSVPDLSIHASRQRYTFIRGVQDGAVVRYQSLDSEFTADLTFDRDGLVVDYPGIGRAAM